MWKFLAALLLLGGPASAQSFGGYPCTDDCSGHEAGYEWADRNGIDTVDDCAGNSNSFNEGCRAYVEESDPEQSSLATDRDGNKEQSDE